jgi:hypothetical protein
MTKAKTMTKAERAIRALTEARDALRDHEGPRVGAEHAAKVKGLEAALDRAFATGAKLPPIVRKDADANA